jgi:SNF2 family DNA or RNA helicase
MPGVIVSRPNQALVVPRTGRTIMMFPDAHDITSLSEERLLVPHNIQSTVALRHLGYQLPNPMLCYYDWRGGKPFAVQRATCDLMTTTMRSYVLNSMGTGKTKAALWSWDYLATAGLVGKLLVVATLSTLNFVWGAEAFATLPHRKVAILHGSKARRLELFNSDAEIFVINHDGLRTIQAALTLRTDINVLCLDELAVYRNNSDRSKEMRKFSERFKVVWGLTGAPMPQSPTDVWAQAKIVTPHTVPKFFRQAQEMLMVKKDQFKWIPKANAIDTAFKMLQPSVRYSLDAVVELPEVLHSTVDVPLTSQQDTVYKTLSKAFQTDVAGHTITAANAAVAMGKLLQVSGGWVYAGEFKTVALDAKPRQDMLVDLINQNERKVLVFAPFTHTLDGLSPILTAAGIEHCKVDGRDGQAQRSNYFNLFQNTDKYKVLLAHPTCLAHGLTLTAADMIIWYMPITSLDIYDQANARITRIGQRHVQRIVHLQSTPVERKIYRLLRTKANVQEALLALLASATGDAPT